MFQRERGKKKLINRAYNQTPAVPNYTYNLFCFVVNFEFFRYCKK